MNLLALLLSITFPPCNGTFINEVWRAQDTTFWYCTGSTWVPVTTDAGFPGFASSAQALTYYVSPSGSDSAACTQAAPCKSFQHVLDATPHYLAGGSVTINAAAGNYDGFVLSGFIQGYSAGSTIAGISLVAPMVTSILASGSATGTATSGTAGNGQTVLGVLNKTAAGWTAHDLAGRFVRIASGTGVDGVDLPILDNGTASLTVAGYFLDGIDSTSHYVIEDSGARINTATGYDFAGEACAVFATSENLFTLVQGLAFDCTSASEDVLVFGNGQVDFIDTEFRDSATGTANLSIEAGANGVVGVFNSTSKGSSVSKHWQHIDSTSGCAAGLLELNFVSMYGGTNGVQKSGGITENWGSVGVTNISGMGVGLGGNLFSTAIPGIFVTCNNISTGIGLGVGSMADGQINDDAAYFGQTSVAGVDLTTTGCNQATATMGPAALELTNLAGSCAQAVYADHSARVLVKGAGFLIDAGTYVYLDDGNQTGDPRSVDGGCIFSPATGSGVCVE